MRAAVQVALTLTEADWLEAFGAHPKIGDRVGSAWSKQEQSRARATEETAEDLERLNQEYFDRFGFIFIICATGKSAEEILVQLQQRLENSQEVETKNAASEQRKITSLRLRKLLGL